MPSIHNYKKTGKSMSEKKVSSKSQGDIPAGIFKSKDKKKDALINSASRRLRSESPVSAVEEQRESVSTEFHSSPETTDFTKSSEEQKSSVDTESTDTRKFVLDSFLKRKLPARAQEVIETVVQDWKNGGDFEGLPVGHPLAQIVVSKGLKKAKSIEKKLEEKGVFLVTQMGLQYVKSTLNKAPWNKK